MALSIKSNVAQRKQMNKVPWPHLYSRLTCLVYRLDQTFTLYSGSGTQADKDDTELTLRRPSNPFREPGENTHHGTTESGDCHDVPEPSSPGCKAAKPFWAE